jgi:hypothetical protein
MVVTSYVSPPTPIASAAWVFAVGEAALANQRGSDAALVLQFDATGVRRSWAPESCRRCDRLRRS